MLDNNMNETSPEETNDPKRSKKRNTSKSYTAATFITKMCSLLAFLKKNILLCLGIAGIVLSLWFSFSKGNLPDIPPNQLKMPPLSPFNHTVSGVGFVEGSSKNIGIGSYMPGIVQSVHVKEGDRVSAKQPLFELDTREALLDVANDELEVRLLQLLPSVLRRVDRKSTRLNSSHCDLSRMPSSA